MTEQGTEYKTTTNGKSNTNTDANKHKVKRRTCGIPVLQPLSEMALLRYEARIEAQPVSFEEIKNYEFFSPSQDGSRLMQKINRSKSLDIQSNKTIPTSFGRGYRIHLEANPSAEKADF